MSWEIPLFKIYWDEEDIARVSDVIKRGMGWAIGKEVEEFEGLIAEYFNRKYAVVFNSGTSALHAALIAHEIGPGDEVLVPSFTFIATANAPLFVGAKPVFVDIEEDTYGMDPEDLRRKITERTKAIIPVHYSGLPCRIKKIKDIARENGLIVIEDAAEAFGAAIDGKKVGTLGDSAMFSFCQNKIITTGDGGVIVTDSEDIYYKLKLVRSHGRSDNSDYFVSAEKADYISLGYNFRLSNISAALGIAQIKKANMIIEFRRNRAKLYNKALKDIKQIRTFRAPEGYHHVYQMFTIRAEKRDDLMSYLAKKGIMSKVYFDPIHKTLFYRGMGYNCKLPVTERLSEEVLTLPMYPDLMEEEINGIARAIKEFYEVSK